MIQLKDLFQDFLNFWETAHGKDQEEKLRLWQELYESKHPAVFVVYFSPPHWGRREGLPEAFARMAALRELVEVDPGKYPRVIGAALREVNEG